MMMDLSSDRPSAFRQYRSPVNTFSEESSDFVDGPGLYSETDFNDEEYRGSTPAMASTNPLGQMEELAQCPICQELLSDARQLLCLHTFCARCLNSLLDSAKQQGKGKFSCPLCREMHPLPADGEGVDAFPSSYFLSGVSDTVQRFKDVVTNNTCSSCAEDGSHIQAHWVCVECIVTLCDSCKTSHDKFLRSHKTLLIGKIHEKDLEKQLSRRTQFCAVHADKKVEVFCQDCQELCCISCFVTRHNGHDVTEIAAVVPSKRNKLAKTLAELENENRQCTQSAGGLKHLKASIGEEFQINATQIRERANVMRKRIDDYEQRLLVELEEELSEVRQYLGKYEDQVKASVSHVNNCGRYIRSVLQKGSPTDIVQTAIKEHELFTKVRDQAKDSALDPGAIQFSFDMRLSGNLEQVDRSFGNIVFATKVSEFELPFKPAGITVCDNRDIVVCGTFTNQALIYSDDGRCSRPLEVPLESQLWDAAIYGDEIYVTDAMGKLNVFDMSGAFKRIVSLGMQDARGIDIMGTDVFITTYSGNYVKRFNVANFEGGVLEPQGELFAPTKNPAALKKPLFIAASDYSIVVTHRGPQKVLSYNKEQECVFKYGGDMHVWGCCIDRAGRTIVADIANNNLAVLSPSGSLLGHIATEVDGLNIPRSVALGPTGDLCVTCGPDTGPWRMVTFKYKILA